MNKERLEELALWLEAGAPHKGTVDKFNMNVGVGVGACGTACCIAGAATQFFAPPDIQTSFLNKATEEHQAIVDDGFVEDEDDVGQADFFGFYGVMATAMDLLDLSKNTAGELFTPYCIDQDDWEKITPQMAAKTIRHLMATGEVDWTHTGLTCGDNEDA